MTGEAPQYGSVSKCTKCTKVYQDVTMCTEM